MKSWHKACNMVDMVDWVTWTYRTDDLEGLGGFYGAADLSGRRFYG
jgi:hypothetical protein